MRDDARVGLTGVYLVVLLEAHSDEQISVGAVGACRAAEVAEHVLDEAVRSGDIDVRHALGGVAPAIGDGFDRLDREGHGVGSDVESRK